MAGGHPSRCHPTRRQPNVRRARRGLSRPRDRSRGSSRRARRRGVGCGAVCARAMLGGVAALTLLSVGGAGPECRRSDTRPYKDLNADHNYFRRRRFRKRTCPVGPETRGTAPLERNVHSADPAAHSCTASASHPAGRYPRRSAACRQLPRRVGFEATYTMVMTSVVSSLETVTGYELTAGMLVDGRYRLEALATRGPLDRWSAWDDRLQQRVHGGAVRAGPPRRRARSAQGASSGLGSRTQR